MRFVIVAPLPRADTSYNHPKPGERTMHRDVECPLGLAERAEAGARMRSGSS